MKRIFIALLMLVTAFAIDGYSQMVAEQITKDNAANRLFSGSDPNGGVGDWYISNGVVEAVIDNAAFNPDLAAKGISFPIQFLVSPTGGTLIDLGLVGKNNDQFNQMFQVVNLTPTNAFFYLRVRASATPELATLTSEGIALFPPFSTTSDIAQPKLPAQTTYSLAAGDKFITVTSTIVNLTSGPIPLFNISDGIILAERTILPFAPSPGRGFNNPTVTLTPEGIAAALGLFPFVGLPGNLGPDNGIIDTATNTVCGEVSYGYTSVSVAIDPDGPAGPQSPQIVPLSAVLGFNSSFASALGNPFDPAASPMIPVGGSFTFTRRIFLGERNDVAAVSDTIYKNLLDNRGSPIAPFGTLTGDIDAQDNADVEASLIFEGKLPLLFGDRTLPMTQVRTDKTGKFSVLLPAGDYTVSIVSPERSDMKGVAVKVNPGTSVAQLPKLSPVGTISYNITEKGNPVPAKLTFIGMDGTPNPDFSRIFTAVTFDPKTGAMAQDLIPSSYVGGPAMNFVFTAEGTGKQTIKPGKYEVIASRGIEYTVSIKTVSIAAGEDLKMDFALERVVDTTGFISADLHVHSGKSPDSSAPLEDRIRSYVAENVEVIVSTEHNYIIDYAPIVDKLKLRPFTKTIVGNELTTSLPVPNLLPNGFGHHNAFPLLVDKTAPRRGAPFTEYVQAATFYDRIKLNNPGVQKVIQLNHPRAGQSGLTVIGLFNAIRLDPRRAVPLTLLSPSALGTTTRNIDFDCMELFNGDSIGGYQVTRNDWVSLINQPTAFIKTATAVSDSHRVVIEAPGFPRSFIASPTDDPAAITDDIVTKGLLPDKASGALTGRVVGSSGPFIRFDINGSPMGSLVKKTSGKVKLNITVTAPAWVPVEEVRILENGRTIMTFNATSKIPVTAAPVDPTSNQGVERFKATVKIKPKKDAYYTVEAGVKLPDARDTNDDGVIDTGDTNGDGLIDSKDRGFVQPPSPTIYAKIAPGFSPLAFTNPIFIDRNGNGKFDPPGLDANPIPTAVVERDVIEETPITSTIEHFPWRKIKIGNREMEKFVERLSVLELNLIAPLKKDQ